jgi:hypothetical protein
MYRSSETVEPPCVVTCEGLTTAAGATNSTLFEVFTTPPWSTVTGWDPRHDCVAVHAEEVHTVVKVRLRPTEPDALVREATTGV